MIPSLDLSNEFPEISLIPIKSLDISNGMYPIDPKRGSLPSFHWNYPMESP